MSSEELKKIIEKANQILKEKRNQPYGLKLLREELNKNKMKKYRKPLQYQKRH